MVQQRSQKHYLEFISSIPSFMVEQCHGNIVNRLCSSFMSGPHFLCFILGHTPVDWHYACNHFFFISLLLMSVYGGIKGWLS